MKSSFHHKIVAAVESLSPTKGFVTLPTSATNSISLAELPEANARLLGQLKAEYPSTLPNKFNGQTIFAPFYETDAFMTGGLGCVWGGYHVITNMFGFFESPAVLRLGSLVSYYLFLLEAVRSVQHLSGTKPTQKRPEILLLPSGASTIWHKRIMARLLMNSTNALEPMICHWAP